ncbi:hypothetical protein AK812_SmicGene4811 [Symbiodinium microadriaticum]|uniref:Uncharacterized protein n=1 Tax=Symbiodinium microadriaticum TaxID=2951 RepID=A0A1Q9EVA0_SYMMI|nr:hypothetical protein AK812_SmicGene4811 [Symbiodinium microadriaticum]
MGSVKASELSSVASEGEGQTSDLGRPSGSIRVKTKVLPGRLASFEVPAGTIELRAKAKTMLVTRSSASTAEPHCNSDAVEFRSERTKATSKC